MRTCSLTVNGPGFIEMPRIFQSGSQAAAARPTGKDSSWATMALMVTDGKRKKKNWFRPGIKIAQARPITHVRKVVTGMSGSSVLATADRTSG
jgi:hypothetical protein